jgi:phage terminase large subunit GpA-like protein
MSRAGDLARSLFKRSFAPKTTQRMADWLTRWVIVPMISGSRYPGRLKLTPNPWMQEWLEAYQAKAVHFITIAKSARVGGTLFTILTILWKIVHRPGPIMIVDPTADSARRFSRQELQPFLLECKPVAELRLLENLKESWTLREMILKTCTLGLVGSNSPTPLAGRQAEDLHLNETDKFVDNPSKEAPPAELAEARTIQFEDTRKIIRNSTPTTFLGLTWRNFLKGSQEYCYVPCPHCKDMQRLTFFPEDRIGAKVKAVTDSNGKKRYFTDGKVVTDKKGNALKTGRIKFDHCKNADGSYDLDRVQREAVYECQSCQKDIKPEHRNAMMAAYQWRSHNPKAPSDHRSFHIWAAYSDFTTWGWIANEFLNAKGDLGKMHNFHNAVLGLPFRLERSNITAKTIENVVRTSPKYRRGQLCFKPAVITLQVDVQSQANGFWWMTTAFDSKGAIYVLDWGDARSWEDIEALLGTTYKFGKEDFSIQECAIDMGHRTTEVYDFCIASGHLAKPFQGRTTAHRQFRPITASDIEHEGNIISLTQFLDPLWKDVMYLQNLAARAGKGIYLPEMESKPSAGDGTDAQLIEQLTDEQKQLDGSYKDSGKNHLGDCLKMAVVGGSLMAIHLALQDGEKAEEEDGLAEAA